MAGRDDEVTRLAHDLGNVIRRTLAGSEEVAECLERIKGRGFELSVSLEATVAFAPTHEGVAERAVDAPPLRMASEARPRANYKMTPLDKKFLRSLKISVEDDE
jgi:hypothetical protein